MKRGAVIFALFALACSDAADDASQGSAGSAGASDGGNSGGSGGIAGNSGFPDGGAAGGSAAAGSAGASGSAGAAGGAGGSVGAGANAGATGTGGVASDVCAGHADGKYCAGVVGGTANHLYTCSADATSADKACANGCFKADGDDACASKCCIGKPPGTIPFNGQWNACPYSSSVSSRDHMGVDYTSKKGTPIPASMDGTVWHIRNNGDPNCYNGGCSSACLASGNRIVLKAACGDPLKPGNDLFLLYHHINGVAKGIKVGSKVARGTNIATVGDSGCATGPHIHFQVASHPKGKYKQGSLPDFWSCSTAKNPTTRLCSALN